MADCLSVAVTACAPKGTIFHSIKGLPPSPAGSIPLVRLRALLERKQRHEAIVKRQSLALPPSPSQKL